MTTLGLTHVTTVPTSLRFFRGQVEYMKARGFEVRAITSPGEELDRFAGEYEIAVSAVEMARRITPLADLQAVWAMRRLLLGHRPAIVHAHTPKGGLLGLIAAVASATPVRIYHMRGLPFTSASGWRRSLLGRTEWLSCRLAHHVYCVSRSVRTVAVEAGICPADKITVLGHGSGNGVDATERFDPDLVGGDARREIRAIIGARPDEPVIGYVGRLVRAKGIVELIEAWRDLRRAGYPAHLLVIGRFELQDALPAETEHTLRNDPRIHLIGTTWEIPRWYAAMDLLVLPTYREGFPNVVLEAAAMRLPVVATRVPGCVDAVEDGTTGMVVPPRDAGAVAGAIRVYLADPALRRFHGAAGRRRVLMHFRPEAIWEALYREYVRLLDRAGVTIDRFACTPTRPSPAGRAAAPARTALRPPSTSAWSGGRSSARRSPSRSGRVRRAGC
jgi:glycosyltransferase involved in cell wall biosynthesis